MRKIRIDKSKEEWVRSLEDKVELLEEGEDFFKEDYNRKYQCEHVCLARYHQITNQLDFYYSYNGGKGSNITAWFHGYLKEDETGLYLYGRAKHSKGLIYYIGLIFILIVMPGFELLCGVFGMDTIIECLLAFVFVNFIFFLQGRFVISNMLNKLRQI